MVGQYATQGCGGSTNAVILLEGIQIKYTASTELQNETQRPIFQGVSVQPDVRMPVTEEIQRLNDEGRYPVLETAKPFLIDKSFDALDLEPSLYAGGTIASVAPSLWKIDSIGGRYAKTNRPNQPSIAQSGQSDDREPDQIAASIDADATKL